MTIVCSNLLLVTCHWSFLEWLDRLRLRNFVTALFASSSRVVVPEIKHCFTEVVDDIGTITVDVFDQRSAVLAIKNYMFVLTRWAASLDHNADRVRRPHRRMRNVRRNEKRFALAHEMIDDPVALADADFNVALQLIKIFLRVDFMEIVPRIRPFDHHHKKVSPIVKITVADRRLEFFPVLFDPILQIYWRLNSDGGAFFG